MFVVWWHWVLATVTLAIVASVAYNKWFSKYGRIQCLVRELGQIKPALKIGLTVCDPTDEDQAGDVAKRIEERLAKQLWFYGLRPFILPKILARRFDLNNWHDGLSRKVESQQFALMVIGRLTLVAGSPFRYKLKLDYHDATGRRLLIALPVHYEVAEQGEFLASAYLADKIILEVLEVLSTWREELIQLSTEKLEPVIEAACSLATEVIGVAGRTPEVIGIHGRTLN